MKPLVGILPYGEFPHSHDLSGENGSRRAVAESATLVGHRREHMGDVASANRKPVGSVLTN